MGKTKRIFNDLRQLEVLKSDKDINWTNELREFDKANPDLSIEDKAGKFIREKFIGDNGIGPYDNPDTIL